MLGKIKIVANTESLEETEEEKKDAAAVTMRYIDAIDKCVKISCCNDNVCGTYIRNFALTFGCLIVWSWMTEWKLMQFNGQLEVL